MVSRTLELVFLCWFVATSNTNSAFQLVVPCPTDIPTNASLSHGGPASTFDPTAKLTIYIDTSATSYPLPVTQGGQNMYTAISAVAAAWGAYQQSRGGDFKVINSVGYPANPVQPYAVFSQGTTVPIPPGLSAGTTWSVDPTTGFTTNSTTYFTPNFLFQVATGSVTFASAAGLASHEIAQPYGFGDCVTNPNNDCNLSVANDRGNTFIGPTPCDQQMMKAIVTAINSAHPTNSPGGNGNGGTGGESETSFETIESSVVMDQGTWTLTTTEGNIRATLNPDGSSSIVNTTTVTQVDGNGEISVTTTVATTNMAPDGSSVTTVTETDPNGVTTVIGGPFYTPPPSNGQGGDDK